MLQGPVGIVLIIAWCAGGLSVMVYMLIIKNLKGAVGIRNIFINIISGTPGTILKNYGKLGSDSLTGISHSLRLVKYSGEGKVFYVLIDVTPLSGFPVEACRIDLASAEALAVAFRGDAAVPQERGEQKSRVSSIIGFPGKVTRDYGKIGDQMGLLQFDSNGEKYYLLFMGGGTFCITAAIAEKLVDIFQSRG